KHLKLHLRNVLRIYGLPALIFPVSVFPNELQDERPELVPDEEPSGSCKVLLSKPMEGLQISDFISLSDKIETEYRVITDAYLEEQQHLLVTFPDDKNVTLRITQCNVYHSLSTVYWFYTAIAV